MTAANALGATDQEAYRFAVASIRRHSMVAESWKHTEIGELHPGLAELLTLDPGELPESACFSAESWWATTTRRITGCYRGEISSLDPRDGVDANWGDFKGIKSRRGGRGRGAGSAICTARLCLSHAGGIGVCSVQRLYRSLGPVGPKCAQNFLRNFNADAVGEGGWHGNHPVKLQRTKLARTALAPSSLSSTSKLGFLDVLPR